MPGRASPTKGRGSTLEHGGGDEGLKPFDVHPIQRDDQRLGSLLEQLGDDATHGVRRFDARVGAETPAAFDLMFGGAKHVTADVGQRDSFDAHGRGNQSGQGFCLGQSKR
jgi:hypothetical protein